MLLGRTSPPEEFREMDPSRFPRTSEIATIRQDKKNFWSKWLDPRVKAVESKSRPTNLTKKVNKTLKDSAATAARLDLP